MKKIYLYLLLTVVLFFTVTAASAQSFGSNLRAAQNTIFGCDFAPILDPISGFPVLAPTGQTTCTMRNLGYLYSNKITSFVPSNGTITRIRVRSGANPAPLRLTISEGGPGTCCTARVFGKTFRPRANKVTSLDVNVNVKRSTHKLPNGQLAQITDVVGLTAVGPGTLPLHDEGTAGTFQAGSGLTQLWYPLTARGDPRVEGHTADGLELLFQWTFKRNARRPLN
jgi:hypothetical protein